MFTLAYPKPSMNVSTGIVSILTAWLTCMTPISRVLLVFIGVLCLVRSIMQHFHFKSCPLDHKVQLLRTPPGPRGVPIMGFLPFIGKTATHLQFTELAQQYGPVYQIFLGNKRVVVVSDYALVREAFKKPVFSGRPDTGLTKILQGYGVINSDGALWREQRSFLHSTLRDFGAKNPGFQFQHSNLERNIMSQVSELLESLSYTSPEGLHIRVPLARAVSNVIGDMLMSVTFDAEDTDFERLLHLIDDGFRLLTHAAAVNFVPLLRFIPIVNSPYLQIMRNKAETNAFFSRVAEMHKESFDKENVRDIVDAFYDQQKKSADLEKKTYFSEKQLLQLMGDIFSAGMETVTSLLEWGVVYLVRYPEVQEKVREEIDQVIGQERQPEWKDFPNMLYTEATILELLRKANVIALGNTHATLEDTELGGFFIPKKSHVVPNLWAIHMDPELWDDPEAFKPERFLVDGKIVKPPYFMPFSVGRRVCVGDTLARMEVFLFLTSILQRFELHIPEGENPPQLVGEGCLSLKPLPFKISIIPRPQLT